MKKILTLVLLFQGIVFAAFATSDSNDEIGRLSDLEFMNTNQAVYVNDVFIKSVIGIDLDTSSFITKIAKEKCKEPLLINGFSYTNKVILHSDKKIIFVSLQDVRKEFCPNVKGACLYMINKFFIAKDVASYKIDKSFIKNVEVLPSSEIEFFKGQAPFTIIRIFTNTENNRYPMRLR